MPTPRRSKRSSNACDFCRKRKLGCNNAKPKCGHCQERGIACVFSARVYKPRPSNARIRELEQENSRLRGSPSDSDAVAADAVNNGNEVAPLPSSEPTCLAQHLQCTEPHSTHGSLPAFKTVRDKDLPISNAADENARNQLVAHTARQRQLEAINLEAGLLDFEGLDSHTGIEILSNFWNRQHYAGSVVYRPVFMRDMASGGRYFSPLLLNALLFAGSKHSKNVAVRSRPEEAQSSGRPFRRRFEAILHESDGKNLLTSKIPTIQALLVVADALFSWCDEPSQSWHYLGIAISMIVDLGLHIEAQHEKLTGSTAEELEVRRRLFWAAFALDKVQSIYQGRPTRLRESDNSVSVKFLDDHEELESFHTLTFSETPSQLNCPTLSVSTFEQLCKLSVIMDRVLCSLYAEQSVTRDKSHLLNKSKSLQQDLNNWRDGLPDRLAVRLEQPSFSTILPHTLSLLAMYHSLTILLNRPFVSDGHLQSVSASATNDAFRICAKAAAEIDLTLTLYRQYFCLRTVPYFISYATYVSATIHVRLAAQQAPASRAHQRLRTCLDILALQREQCRAPAKTLKILIGLVDWLGVDVGETSALRALDCQVDYANSMESMQSSDLDLGGHGSDCLTSDFSSAMEDFSIDEIMKSFDFESQGLIPPSQIHHGEDSRLDAVGSMLPLADSDLTYQGSYDQLPFPDSLFGFNVNAS